VIAEEEGIFTANELLNPVIIGKDSLIRLENNVTFTKYVNREFDKNFAVPGDKIGLII
jgi:hypothetical protein